MEHFKISTYFWSRSSNVLSLLCMGIFKWPIRVFPLLNYVSKLHCLLWIHKRFSQKLINFLNFPKLSTIFFIYSNRYNEKQLLVQYKLCSLRPKALLLVEWKECSFCIHSKRSLVETRIFDNDIKQSCKYTIFSIR